MTTRPERLIASSDRQLRRLENSAINDLERYLTSSLNVLLRTLRARYGPTLDELGDASPTIREARAAALINELTLVLNTMSFRTADSLVQRTMRSVLRDAYGLGIENAGELLDALGDDPTFIGINLDAIAQVVTGSSSRLSRFGDEAVDKAKAVIIEGMVSGRSYRQVARGLREVVGLQRYQAERIVRTETLIASDDARRDMYAENGVEYVQRYTAQDTRVCGFCVARAGNVYLAREAPATLHPNDRCYNLPWKPEWVGTRIPTDFARNHKLDSRQRAAEQGVQPNFGPAPFERMNNLPVPQAVRVA